MSTTILLLPIVLALLTALLAAAIDLKTGRIPNWLIGSSAATALVYHVFLVCNEPSHPAFRTLLLALYALFACALVPCLLYYYRALGGGDLKLFAVLGLWCGASMGLEVQLYAFVLTTLYAPVKMAYRGSLFTTLGRAIRMLRNPFLPVERRERLPPELMTSVRLGPAIFGGVLCVLISRKVPLLPGVFQ